MARRPRPPLERSITGKPITRLNRVYMGALAFALVGYALGGRGFAYWGVPPLFVGEMVLLLGVFVAIQIGNVGKLLNSHVVLPLLMFCVWGALRTIPFMDRHGVEALRDAVVWGYSGFALVTASVLIANPEFFAKIIRLYGKFVPVFLVCVPLLWLAIRAMGGALPDGPYGVPILEQKGGDVCVHLAGVFVYIVAFGYLMPALIGPLLVPLNLGLNLHGRSGMVSFLCGVIIAMTLRPFHHRAMRIFFVIALGFAVMWATDFRIKDVGGGREISIEYLWRALGSVAGETSHGELAGSKEWRLKWWSDIVNYTFFGEYFWTGKGFGINLADDDGYQLDGTLRSPHNGHLTVLARAGVPGFTLWVIVQLVWLGSIVKSYIRARRRRDGNWAGLFLSLAAYWAAFMTNAAFDVFIEGPMGGIWFWNIMGVGIAAVYVYRRYPMVLHISLKSRPASSSAASVGAPYPPMMPEPTMAARSFAEPVR
jgi:hypothetical protein